MGCVRGLNVALPRSGNERSDDCVHNEELARDVDAELLIVWLLFEHVMHRHRD